VASIAVILRNRRTTIGVISWTWLVRFVSLSVAPKRNGKRDEADGDAGDQIGREGREAGHNHAAPRTPLVAP
jgi:hypothetical protein